MENTQFEKINSIPEEKFNFVGENRVIHDVKLDTKPVGYFRDALRRFAKNKSSVVAFVIILIQLLFAIVTPWFSPYTVDFRDPFYSTVTPSLTVARENRWGFWDGAKTLTGGQSAFDKYASIGYEDVFVAGSKDHNALVNYEVFETTEGSIDEETGEEIVGKSYNMYVDTYQAVGFKFLDLTESAYKDLQEYQNQTGIQVIYPLQRNFLSVAANYWFRLDDVSQKAASEAHDRKQNYSYVNRATAARDADGNFIPDYRTAPDINAYGYNSLRLDFSGTPYEEGTQIEKDAPIRSGSLSSYPVLYDSQGHRYRWYSDTVGYVQEENNAVRAYTNGAVSADSNWYADEEMSEALISKALYYTYAFPNQTGYLVRVNYYEYFRYINGFYPNFVFGTNVYGQDILVCLASGARLSFLLSVGVCVINFIIGAIYGAIEGYYGGVTDLVMERVSDILADVPFIVVATLFQMHLAQKVGPVVSLLFAFVMTGWIGMASRVRMQFYRFKNQEYVLASRTLGASDWRVMWKHIFPNSLGTIVTGAVLAIPGVIFSESMLSYLGIVNLETSSLTSIGTMLSQGSDKLSTYPHVIFFPAVFIALLMISFNLFGNGLRDAFNPTLRGSEG